MMEESEEMKGRSLKLGMLKDRVERMVLTFKEMELNCKLRRE
jgi:hypothetical protein